jgi:DNA-binding transcriptional LysR family regulator
MERSIIDQLDDQSPTIPTSLLPAFLFHLCSSNVPATPMPTAPDQHLLEAFVVLARTLHFGRTARELHLTQSTISHRIRKLELEIQVALFDRTRRSVALTAAGRALLSRARPALAELGHAVEEARQVASGARGRLVIAHSGVASACGLLDALARHVDEAPTIAFEIRQASLASQRQGILRGEIDLGCTFLDLPPKLAGFAVRALPKRPLVAWIAAAHPLAKRRSLTLQDALSQRLIVLSDAVESGFSSFMLDRGVRPRTAARPIAVDSLDACFEFVRRGCGVTLLPQMTLPVQGIRSIPVRPKLEIVSRVFWAEQADNPVLQRYLRLLTSP